MGIILERASIVCSAATIVAMMLGLDPFNAFIVGIVALMPVRMLLGGSLVSQTGMFASAGAVATYYYLGFAPMNAFLVGAASGYFWLYWWIFFYPRILK